MGATRAVGRPAQLDSEIPEFFKHFMERGYDGRRLDKMLAKALKYSDRTVRRVRTERQNTDHFEIRVMAMVPTDRERVKKLFDKSLARWEGDFIVSLVVDQARRNGWRG